MSDDGADLGVTATAGLRAVLGGPAPRDNERKSPEQMRAYLEEHAASADSPDLDEAAAFVGSVFLAYLEKHPEDRELGLDGEYDFTKFDIATGGWTTPDYILTPGLTDVMKQKEPALLEALYGHGFSGFMVGHGLNAAKYALGQAPVSNPAIVDFDV